MNVEDVNDNIPQFSDTAYATTLVDNPVANLIVYQLIATDPDPGPLGKLTYKIVGGDDKNVFTIETHTGLIILLVCCYSKITNCYSNIYFSVVEFFLF